MKTKLNKTRNRTRHLLMALVLGLATFPALQAQQQSITPNYVGVDLRAIVQAVSAVTGKNFIVDPRVRAEVTMLSSTPMSPEAFYEAFLSILAVHGFAAVPAGDITKIIPDASVRQFPGYLSADGASDDDIVTQVIQVQNVGAAQLVPILRPLIPQYGHLAAHPGSNMLIISDRASNVTRMIAIIRRIDQSNDDDIEIVPLQHASSAEVVRVLTALSQTPRADGAPVTTSLVADARTNSVLIGGDKSERLRLRAIIAHLDTPLEDGGDTQVRYLRYADAEELATKLQQHFTQQQTGTAGAGAPAGASAGGASQVSIWADTQTNAIVVTAPPKMMRSMTSIVDKLDIRRAQVLVEAIIVEVIADRTAELGVTWAATDSSGTNPLGATNFPDFGPGVVQLAGAAAGEGGAANAGGLIGTGITVGVGRIRDQGVSFAAILRALEGDADTNIISTPSIVTTDNEEASLNVGQEVPFVTGSFSNTGSVGGAINPFQTIQREQVGVKLTITPQINEGDSLLLKISQEISAIAQSAEGAVDLITNERTIETTVIVEDGEIIVLGGLLEDQLRESDQRVPVLGSIPVIGALFRARKTDKIKTNLMVFIRPKILRDNVATSIETNAKYNYIRDVQQQGRGGKGGRVAIMPGEERPVLPPIEELGVTPAMTPPADANQN
ncbi:MAG: type II secretion system secretin GspD [Gammaproteobacteria bacterium]|nr:type II secretion system secretin GspD [Gammaproteobacteria bacterium]MDH4254561.1 type II secretion system secretin GspD [Gammaproteobacteria bacterium]MDH5310893.1 type II secretion system secretin GspD [Gammaproteobacteria bacterium]